MKVALPSIAATILVVASSTAALGEGGTSSSGGRLGAAAKRQRRQQHPGARDRRTLRDSIFDDERLDNAKEKEGAVDGPSGADSAREADSVDTGTDRGNADSRSNDGWVLDAIASLKWTVEEQGRTIAALQAAVEEHVVTIAKHADTIAELRTTVAMTEAAAGVSDPRLDDALEPQQQHRRRLEEEEYVPPHLQPDVFSSSTPPKKFVDPTTGVPSILIDNSPPCDADSVECRIAALEHKTQFMEVVTTAAAAATGEGGEGKGSSSNTINSVIFENCNLHVRSGSGSTDGPVNGLGNLIVGYDEVMWVAPEGRPAGPSTPTNGVAMPKTGSHNIVGGSKNSYSSYGGLIVGSGNVIEEPWASVTGGQSNKASGYASSVGGGERNVASGFHSTVAGGNGNVAGGDYGSVAGGQHNYVDKVAGYAATILGGQDNQALGYWSTVAGGFNNTAGGRPKVPYPHSRGGYWSFVGGGRNNTAEGHYSTVAGGMNLTDSVDVGEIKDEDRVPDDPKEVEPWAVEWKMLQEEKKKREAEEWKQKQEEKKKRQAEEWEQQQEERKKRESEA